MTDEYDDTELNALLKEMDINIKTYLKRDPILCPFCEGTGQDVVEWQGNVIVNSCAECRGTGEAVELIGEDIPKIIIPE